MSSKLVWSQEKGLHYADKEELGVQARRFARKAADERWDEPNRIRFAHKAAIFAKLFKREKE